MLASYFFYITDYPRAAVEKETALNIIAATIKHISNLIKTAPHIP